MGFFKRPAETCVHSFRPDSTFRTLTVSAAGVPLYRVECSVCGESTELCMTHEEAKLRALRGWME